MTVAKVGINLTALVLWRTSRRSSPASSGARDAVRLSTVDPLTGLFNRNFFFAAVDREIAEASARTAVSAS